MFCCPQAGHASSISTIVRTAAKLQVCCQTISCSMLQIIHACVVGFPHRKAVDLALWGVAAALLMFGCLPDRGPPD